LQTDNFLSGNLVLTRRHSYDLFSASFDKRIPHAARPVVKGSSTVNVRSAARLALFGLALSAALAFGTQELRPPTDIAASSLERAALTSDNGVGVIAGHLATSSGTPAQSMGGGCERERRPNCSSPRRRSTRR
jgi:hypothetical protein